MSCGDVQPLENREPGIRKRSKFHRAAGVEKQESQPPVVITEPRLHPDVDRVWLAELATCDHKVRSRRRRGNLATAVACEKVEVWQIGTSLWFLVAPTGVTEVRPPYVVIVPS